MYTKKKSWNAKVEPLRGVKCNFEEKFDLLVKNEMGIYYTLCGISTNTGFHTKLNRKLFFSSEIFGNDKTS